MSSFSTYEQKQQQKQQKNKHLIQLILCQLDVGGWRKEKGTRLKSQRAVENRENWRKLIVKLEETDCEVICGAPAILVVKG